MAIGLQARPTEYKGVCYRSKSEAMFARWLELSGRLISRVECGNGSCASGFEYEPKRFSVDGWTPDFYYWILRKKRELVLVHQLIEYKPAKPTETYLLELGERFSVVRNRGLDLCFCLYYGSFFGDETGLILFDGSEVTNVGPWASANSISEDVVAYRYDLEDARHDS